MVMRNVAILIVLLAFGLLRFKVMNDDSSSSAKNDNDDNFQKYKYDQEQNIEKGSSSTNKSITKTPMTVKEQSYQVIHADEDVLSKRSALLNKSVDHKSEMKS